METVHFTDSDEFFHEVDLECKNIENGLMRATMQFVSVSAPYKGMTAVDVVATCVIRPAAVRPNRPVGPRYLAKMQKQIGTIFSTSDSIGSKVCAEAEDLVNKIKDACRERDRDIECRPGIIIPDKEA